MSFGTIALILAGIVAIAALLADFGYRRRLSGDKPQQIDTSTTFPQVLRTFRR